MKTLDTKVLGSLKILFARSKEDYTHEGSIMEQPTCAKLAYDHKGLASVGVDLHKIDDLRDQTNFLVPLHHEGSQEHMVGLRGADPPKVIRLRLLGDEPLIFVLQKIISHSKLEMGLWIGKLERKERRVIRAQQSGLKSWCRNPFELSMRSSCSLSSEIMVSVGYVCRLDAKM